MANVAWTMLANYAEDNNGLLYIQGGTWDTISVATPLEGGPPDVFTFIRGFYVARLSFHQTETGREHEFAIVLVDEDASEVARIGGNIEVSRTPGLPPSWPQYVNIVVPLTGVPLKEPGIYRISLLINGNHEDELEFRVIQLF